jgi:hypothetical protein
MRLQAVGRFVRQPCDPRPPTLFGFESALEAAMPEISMPEVKLPKIQLPEGLRDMTADDIAKAMPDVKLPKVEIPSKVDLRNVELPRVQVELPKKLELPKVEIRQKRSGPPWILVGVLALITAGALMLFASPTTGPRLRTWIDNLRLRMAHWRDEFERSREVDPDDARAFPEAERADVQPNPYADDLPSKSTGMTDRTRPLTEGIGSASG